MARTLANYTGIQVPDLVDARQIAAGQVSGQVGGGDFVGAVDDHDHSPGRGAPITQASFAITGDLDMNSQGLTEVERIEFSGLNGTDGVRKLYSTTAGDLVWNDGLEVQQFVAYQSYVQDQISTAVATAVAGLSTQLVKAWARVTIASAVPTLNGGAGLTIQALSTNLLSLLLTTPQPNANYVVVVTNQDTTARGWSVTAHAVGGFSISGNRLDTGALLDLTSGTYRLGIAVFGA